MRYGRVVVKLSGAALAGNEPSGLSSASLAGGIGQPYVTTDHPAVQRALELEAEALLVAKHGVDGVYTADPRHDRSAARYETLSYADAIARDLRVMDPSAFILARASEAVTSPPGEAGGCRCTCSTPTARAR